MLLGKESVRLAKLRDKENTHITPVLQNQETGVTQDQKGHV